MTVAELIDQLQDLPQDLEVLVTDEDGGDCNTIRQVLEESNEVGHRWVFLTSERDPASYMGYGIDYGPMLEEAKKLK